VWWALGVILIPVNAEAQDARDLVETCFTRTYDAEHMKNHPDQRVVQVQAAFQDFGGNLWAGIYYTLLPGGKKFGLSGDCHEAIAGGFLCRVCANDSCEETGETFKILWDGGDSLDFINDETGVTGADSAGGRERLAPGGANQLFRLERASDTAACDWLPN
jgi:hypothetical protein